MRKIFILVFLPLLVAVLAGCGRGGQITALPDTADGTLSGLVLSSVGITCQLELRGYPAILKAKNGRLLLSGIRYTDAATGKSYENGEELEVDGLMYAWHKGLGTGRKIDLQKQALQFPNNNAIRSLTEQVAAWDRDDTEFDCLESGVADDDFLPPADINFSD